MSREGEDTDLVARGRHDPCVVPRAVPMVEAMVALVLADQALQARRTPLLVCLQALQLGWCSASRCDRLWWRPALVSIGLLVPA